jgi:hypothetical protein
VSALAAASVTRPWLLADELPPGCSPDLAARVLLLQDDVARHWRRWLGPLGVDGREILRAAIARSRRLAAPREDPFDAPLPPLHVAIDEGGWRGWIGRREGDGGEVRVLRQGVAVTTLRVAVPLPGIFGVIECPDLVVNAAHDAVEEREIERIEARLAAPVDALAVALWDRHGPVGPGRPLPDPLALWLARRPRDDAFSRRAICVTLQGDPIALSDLERLAGKKRKLSVLSAAPGVPGFESAVLVTPAVRGMLEAWAPGRVRDATPDLPTAASWWRAFLDRPVAGADPPFLAAEAAQGEGWTGRFLLPSAPELVGNTLVEARYADRRLAVREGKGPGAWAIVEGPRFAPNKAFTGLRDENALEAVKAEAARALKGLAARALRQTDGIAHAATWRALYSRIHEKSGPLTAIARQIEKLPLLVALDGGALSLDDVFATTSGGAPMALVSARTILGPTDHPGYLLASAWVAEAVAARLGAPLPDGTEDLLAWRRARDRRASTPRQEPVVSGRVLARRALRASVGVGEVALVAEGSGLSVVPLVDGVALAPVSVPFPAPAAAVVQATSLRTDTAFEQAAAGPELAALVAAAREGAVALAEELVAAAGSGRSDADDWARAYAIRAPGSRPDRPLFATAGGGAVTLGELRRRQREDGGIGWVAATARPPPTAVPPLVDAPALAVLREQAFTLVELPAFAPPTRGGPWRELLGETRVPPPRSGAVGFSPTEDATLEVRSAGAIVARIVAADPVSLTGTIVDDRVRLDALCRDIAPGPDRDALHEVLGRLSRAVLRRLIDDPVVAVQPALLGALRRLAPDGPSLLAAVAGSSEDTLLCALARAPLFVDSTDLTGSLADVLGSTPVRVVGPTGHGQPGAGRTRVWRVPPSDREWLSAARPVVAAEDELAAEDLGVRRRRQVYARSQPTGASEALHTATARGVLWLGQGGGPAVVVGGAFVAPLDAGVPGLAGYVEGAFPTDVAFTRATVDDETRAAVGAAAGRLLAEEARQPETRWRTGDRLVAAASGRGSSLWAWPGDPWSSLVLFEDIAGRPVALGEVAASFRELQVLSYVPGDAPREDAGPSLVLRLPPRELGWVLAVFSKKRVRPREEKRDRRWEATARGARRRAVAWMREGGVTADAPEAPKVPPAWLAGVEGQAADGIEALGAWWLAAVALDGDGAAEIVLLERVAAALEQVVRGAAKE